MLNASPAFVISASPPLSTSPVSDKSPLPSFLTTKLPALSNLPPKVKSVAVSPLIILVMPSLSTVEVIVNAPVPLFVTIRLPSLSRLPPTDKSVPEFVIVVLSPFTISAPTDKKPIPSLMICNEFALLIVPFTVALLPLFNI